MMERATSRDGVVFYRSSLLQEAGCPHAFSTRLGGVSGGPFDSLNLGNPSGCAQQDQTERIRENYRRLMAAAGCEGRVRARVHQVHGAEVIEACASHVPEPDIKADAIVTTDRRCAVAVRTADCIPILLASPDGRVTAAVHAGWRGAVAGVATQAVRRLCGLAQRRPGELLAAVGPCIGFERFEVGPEVLEAFRNLWGEEAPVRQDGEGKGRVDIRGSVLRELLAAGLQRERVDVSDRCTFRDADEFYSHRREHGITGRMASVIGPRE